MNVKFKCPVDINSLKFSGSNLENINAENTIHVSEGTIIPDGGTSTSGIATDVISFKIALSDERGVIYTAV